MIKIVNISGAVSKFIVIRRLQVVRLRFLKFCCRCIRASQQVGAWSLAKSRQRRVQRLLLAFLRVTAHTRRLGQLLLIFNWNYNYTYT